MKQRKHILIVVSVLVVAALGLGDGTCSATGSRQS